MSREITLSKAVNEAIAEEMRRDPTIFLIGEDVAEAGTPFASSTREPSLRARSPQGYSCEFPP